MALSETTYLTPKEVAARLKMSVGAVYDLCNSGALQYCKFGAGSRKRIRILASSLDDYERRSMQVVVPEETRRRRRSPEMSEDGFAELRKYGWRPNGVFVSGRG